MKTLAEPDYKPASRPASKGRKKPAPDKPDKGKGKD